MSDSKVLFVYKDEGDKYSTESLWATKLGNYYRIDNIPFLVSNIALNDLVSVEKEGGALYFNELIESSGHSVVQLLIFDQESVLIVGRELENFGCNWEGSHIPKLISVDIPKQVTYEPIKKYLDEGEKWKLWSYKEACLAHKN